MLMICGRVQIFQLANKVGINFAFTLEQEVNLPCNMSNAKIVAQHRIGANPKRSTKILLRLINFEGDFGGKMSSRRV